MLNVGFSSLNFYDYWTLHALFTPTFIYRKVDYQDAENGNAN